MKMHFTFTSFFSCLRLQVRNMVTVLGLFTCVFILTMHSAKGQPAGQLVDRYMQSVRTSPSPVVPAALYNPSIAETVMEKSALFYNDTLPVVRAGAYRLIAAIGANSSEPAIRMKAVNQLVKGSADMDVLNQGIVWNSLTEFHKQDFSAQAKDTLKNVLRRKAPYLDRIVRLIGYLEITALTKELRPLTKSPTNKSERWATLLALARMGDAEAILSVTVRSKQLPVNDDVVYTLFPDLVYTRQPDAINYMITVLNSDEKKCSSPRDDQPILCGYRVMEQLAPVIVDYPLALDKSGDLNTSDYAKALADVRQWFKQKGSSYQISKDKF